MRCTALLGTLLLAGCQTFTSTLFLQNGTDVELLPYPVVTTPAPPHREAEPARAIAPTGRYQIDTGGFNPVFYAANLGDPGTPNGIFVGLDFYDAEPPVIHIQLLYHPVPPGQEGNVPGLQPVVLREAFVEIVDEDYVIRVERGVPGTGDLPVVVRIEKDTAP